VATPVTPADDGPRIFIKGVPLKMREPIRVTQTSAKVEVEEKKIEKVVEKVQVEEKVQVSI
jgi:hypothetical protein